MTLGEQLTLGQKRSGMTREDIRGKTGHSLPTIRKAMNDNKKVTLEVVESIAEAVGIKKLKYVAEF